MAPPRRPNDRPHRRCPEDRDADDWDWGDDWGDDTGGAPTTSRARPAGAAERGPTADDPARSGDPARSHPEYGDHDEHDAYGRDDDPHGPATREPRSNGSRSAGPRPGGSRAAAVRRRRLLVGGGTLVVLLIAILAISSLASGGDDEPTASVPLLSGPMEAAASESIDALSRVDAVRRFAAMGQPIYCGGGKKPWVALTYDDGPGALSPKWISLLSKERIPVTSFRVGSAVPGNERYVEVQRNLGWDNGTHTQSHPDLTKLDEAGQRREILGGIEASARVLGRKPDLFRPPYQAHNATTDKILKDLGQVQVLWNVDTEDSLGPTTVDKIAKNAIEGLRPGSIILMHEIKDQTYKAMPAIIKAMRERKLEPVTISQMLAGDPPSEEQVRKGYAGCITQEAAGPGEANRPGEAGGTEAT